MLQACAELAYVLPRVRDVVPRIGVLTQSPARWYVGEAISGVEEGLGTSGCQLVLHEIGDPARRQVFFRQSVRQGQLDALILISSSFDEIERRTLDRLGVPIVVIGGHAPGLPCVGIDDEAAGRMATRHLIGLGHRAIGMISFEPWGSAGDAMTQGRRRGFESALFESGLDLVPEWIVSADDSRMAGGVRAAERLLSLRRLPTALFAMSDELAIGALRTLRRAGISVPGHMSLIGFDDHELAPYMDLTTIHQPVRQQGRKATELRARSTGAATAHPIVDHPVRRPPCRAAHHRAPARGPRHIRSG